jgi:esterase/lipase superfamily enzyme
MKGAKRFKDHAFVFVHGYRVGFDDAVFRTAQIAHDLRFDSAAFLFSWPSSGTVWGYFQDGKRVLGARDSLRKYIELVRRESGAKQIHLIAHSMGSQLLLETMRDMAKAAPAGGGPIFNEVIFAAADVTRQNFVAIAKAVRPLASGATLYASANDVALTLSNAISLGEQPAGKVPSSGPPVIVKGVDTIDASAVSTDFFSLNHSDFADRWQLLKDIEALLSQGTHPPKRRLADVFDEVAVPSGVYWRYKQQ